MTKSQGACKATKERAAVVKYAVVTESFEAIDLKDEKELLQKLVNEIAEKLETRNIQVYYTTLSGEYMYAHSVSLGSNIQGGL